MREKYESLSLADLKDIAKHRRIKSVSAMKKSQVIEAMLALDEQEKLEKEKQESESVKQETAQTKPETEQEKTKPEAERAKTKPERNTNPRPRQGRIIMNNQPARNQDNHAMQSRPARSQESYEAQSRPVRSQESYEAQSRPVHSQESYEVQNSPVYVQDAMEIQNQQAENRDIFDLQNREAVYVQETPAEYHTKVTERSQENVQQKDTRSTIPSELDSGLEAKGILEVLPEGFGFIRSDNYMPGDQDVYVSPSQIRRFNLKTGDIVCGNTRVKTEKEKFSALLYIKSVNGMEAEVNARRFNFEDMTPIFPDKRMVMERPGCSVAMRVMDLLSPIGKGQRGMIVSPPKAGKTTLLKEVAQSIQRNHPDVHLIILLIDERPEEVTDIKEAIQGDKVEVIHSTFDELPEHHKRVAEMTIERAKRLVEHRQNVCILLDSITRLTRAYNLTVPPSGRTLSGGLDPASLHMPKRFFGAARNMREGGSLTILATALVDTGSKMDDVVYEEFKGTGNMEMILDRKLSEKRIFPAIDIPKSGTRREDLLLSKEEIEAVTMMRRGLNGMKADEAVDKILDLFARTRNNYEFVQIIRKQRLF